MIVKEEIEKAKAEKQPIKCVIWDLDNTLWDGVLLEDETVVLRKDVVEVIKTLDQRGILNAIASKNVHEVAMAKLEAFGIADYFLYPEINWNAKSTSIQTIARSINIGLDVCAFVDDQPFERDEVAHQLPEVMCIDANDALNIPNMPQLTPRFITSESKLRRQMYQNDIKRKQLESDFTGADEEFLATLNMVFTIKYAEEADLQRAEELTVRTHQLNTTGYTYSYQELSDLRQSDDNLLLVASLDDKYGTYGTIGLALVNKTSNFWSVKLLLMSCRVMSRGVGTIMVNYIMSQAKAAGVPLRAAFLPNGRNRMMYVTYKFGGFKEVEKHGELIILENNLTQIQPYPDYVQLHLPNQKFWYR